MGNENHLAANAHWLAFPPFVTEEKARERFQRRFGQPPRMVKRAPNLLLVGPVPIIPLAVSIAKPIHRVPSEIKMMED